MNISRYRAIGVNILKTPILCSVFVACLSIAVLLPTYSSFFIMPLFVEQVLKNAETDAQRSAAFLTADSMQQEGILENFTISKEMRKKLNEAQTYLDLDQLKIYSASGEIIYSSNDREVGTINEHDYFRREVAKGRIYSKIVKKDEETMEGRSSQMDVAEIYIPIMKNNVFQGAFEIYYDITRFKTRMDTLLARSSYILYTISTAFLLSVAIILFKASEAAISRKEAEKELQQSNSRLEKEIAAKTEEIKATQKTSIEALAILAEYYDSDTGEHLTRIQKYVMLLTVWLKDNSPYAEYINSKPNYIEEIKLASLLHDIGKTSIAREILAKPGKLTSEEFEIIKNHTLIAGDVLNKANSTLAKYFSRDTYLALARDVALFHHERWDGQGYPFGIKEGHIPLSARIVAVADVYDAITCKRAYKEACSHSYAIEEIVKNKGVQFDPLVVDAFLAQAEKFHQVAALYSCCGNKEFKASSDDVA